VADHHAHRRGLAGAAEPRKVVTAPGRTVKLSWSTAVIRLQAMVRSRTSMPVTRPPA
jgi:hypothetical protein